MKKLSVNRIKTSEANLLLGLSFMRADCRD